LGSAPPRQTYVIIFGAAVRPDGTPSGTLRRRVAAGIAYAGKAGLVRFLVTGGAVRNPPAEAVVMRRLLLDQGIAEAHILVEDKARNTHESAVLCSAILTARDDVGRVAVCTSRYHMARCRMLLRLHGIPTVPGAASEDAIFVGTAGYAYAWLREILAFPLDAVRSVWAGRCAGRS
jgi:uncharacterized SAM-binding protein YcdF (DUF218 family)